VTAPPHDEPTFAAVVLDRLHALEAENTRLTTENAALRRQHRSLFDLMNFYRRLYLVAHPRLVDRIRDHAERARQEQG
jgi:hypothetical protein